METPEGVTRKPVGIAGGRAAALPKGLPPAGGGLPEGGGSSLEPPLPQPLMHSSRPSQAVGNKVRMVMGMSLQRSLEV